MVELSEALLRMKPSATNAATQKARELRSQGRSIVSLTAGEPDFRTPAHVVRAAFKAMEEGKTKYPPTSGIAELRQAACDKFRRDNGLNFVPDDIIVSNGGKQVIANAILATVGAGEEVIIPAPYWVSYPELVTFAGGRPIIIPTTSEQRFKVTPEQLDAAITEQTKWFIINSPSNPTGSTYSLEEIQALAEVLLRKPWVSVLSDEIYEHLTYEQPFCSFASAAPGLLDRILTVNGLSKAYAMTGWRVGFAAGPRDLIKAMSTIQGQTTSGVNAIAQWAGVEALNGPQEFLSEWRETFRSRRNLVVGRMKAAAGLDCEVPDGAFYVFPSCKGLLGKASSKGKILHSDLDFADALLEEGGVAVVSGAAFGIAGHFRISCAASDEELIEACTRITDFCAAVR